VAQFLPSGQETYGAADVVRSLLSALPAELSVESEELILATA
jgi:hypothetical protein